MADLTKPMPGEEIGKLDYFDKSQLYHNVYYNLPYNQLPYEIRECYNADDGLDLVQSIVLNSNLRNPYALAKLIKAIKPDMPQTYQEIYARALYLADVCETVPEKILRSELFNTSDFIPKLTEETIQTILENKTLGFPISLKTSDYTPTEEEPENPTQIIVNGDYVEEKKVYFTISNNEVSCETSYNEIIDTLPKLPAAELLLNAEDNYQNINNVSCGYDEEIGLITYDFIKTHNNSMELYSIHYTLESLTLEKKDFIIDMNN